MTDVSLQMYDKICKYCGNCDGEHCLADVPWYCVSIHCRYFLEEKIEVKPIKKRAPSMERIMKKTLVETF
jgi:hypothetical protein